MKKTIIIIALLMSFGISQQEDLLSLSNLADKVTLTKRDVLELRLNAYSRMMSLDEIIIEPPLYKIFLTNPPTLFISIGIVNQIDITQQWYLDQPDKIKRDILTQVKNRIISVAESYVITAFVPDISNYRLPETRVKMDIFYCGAEEAKVKNGKVILKGEKGYYD